jgi:dipeptidyl aminopeptidase/acylaminoacyl peptidase
MRSMFALATRSAVFACSVLHLAAALFGQNAADTASSLLIRPGENLTVSGIPEIPLALADTVRRYTEARSASAPDWHPSERSLLILTRFANANQVHRVRMPLGARYQLTFFNEPVGSPMYEPKSGAYFLFTKDTGGNEFAQIYRDNLVTGELALLTDGGRSQNGNWQWNHAQDRIAYASTSRNGTDRDVWIMDPSAPQSNRLLIQCSGGGWSVQDWSPDDRHLLVMEFLSVNKSVLYLANVETSQLEMLTDRESEVAYGGAAFSADGRSIYLTSDAQGEFQQLGLLDLETRKTTWLTGEIPWSVTGFELSHDGKQIAFTTNEAGISRTYLLDTATGKKRRVSGLPEGVASLGTWRSDDSEFAISVSSARSASDIYSVDRDSLQTTRWTESEMGGLTPEELSEPQLVTWKSFDDRTISGFLYRPARRFTGKRPLIINIHGGPEGQSRPDFLGRLNYFLNELGCAIVFPNVRGSVGYGKSFTKLDNGLRRLDAVRDIGALLDWIATQDDIDSQRIMVTGGSYGGYMTLACAVEYNDRIACSLDVVGISHFGTFLRNTESYRRDLRRAEYGDERSPEMAEFFEKSAPLNNAHRITKPLFVVQGGNDPRVPRSEAEQMVARIQANGSPVWYLMAKDEGHGFRKKNNADFQFYATVEFVKKYLLGQQ